MGLSIIFEPLFDDTRTPTRATARSAGFDLYVYLKGREVEVRAADGTIRTVLLPNAPDAGLHLAAGDIALLPLGFKARLPDGFEAQIRMRSSWAYRRGLSLPNAPGTIDADYPDEWMVMMKASDQTPTAIVHGDRVAQAVVSCFDVPTWETGFVAQSSDRTGGFGSTG